MSVIRTGFIGLGSQGGPMAERMLEAGFPLTVWARRQEVMDEFAAKGASVASSLAELGSACDHVGVCVVDDAGVAEVCNQLVRAMKPGSLLAIHSTILPDSCEELEMRCAERGVLFLDAPVSGGGPGAEAGTLTVMCGGSEEAFDRARPVFESFGKLIVRLGGAGAGQRAKLINNALMAAKMGLSHAAFEAGEKLGLDRTALGELVSESSGRSYAFDVYARLPDPRSFAVGAPLLAKDVGLLIDMLGRDDHAQLLRMSADHFLKEVPSK